MPVEKFSANQQHSSSSIYNVTILGTILATSRGILSNPFFCENGQCYICYQCETISKIVSVVFSYITHIDSISRILGILSFNYFMCFYLSDLEKNSNNVVVHRRSKQNNYNAKLRLDCNNKFCEPYSIFFFLVYESLLLTIIT